MTTQDQTRQGGDSAPDELRAMALFDGLSTPQLRQLWEAGTERRFTAGEVLFHESRAADHWWLLLEGDIALVRRVGNEETILGHMAMPGQWAGGFRAWDEHGVYMASGRAVSDGRLLTVPADELGRLARDWSDFVVHLITGLVATARRIESTARQREALIALGKLSAGLAHELNNPASAAVRSVEALRETTDDLLTSLRQLAAAGISADQFIELDTLRLQVQPSADAPPPRGGLDLADREDELSDWLEDHEVDKSWLLAPPLAAVGCDVDWCERMRSLLGDGPALGHGLEWVASSLTTSLLLGEVKESTGRISGLVTEIKSYSQMDRASLQQTDLHEGLESTLTIMRHKIPAGIQVVREYADDLPTVEAMAGELNQVWTNLIDNAVDAMDGEGTLRITTRAVEDCVEVEIADTGSGMSDEVRSHAFEPFYTTKDVGKGTGLGLDVSRRIVVERHGGDIVIESRPGETLLLVRIPVEHPPD
jgi:signal transduction histidine kinase